MVLDPDSGQYDPHPSLEQMASALAFLTERVSLLERKREKEAVDVRLEYLRAEVAKINRRLESLRVELARIKRRHDSSAKHPPNHIGDDTAGQ